MAPPGSIFSSTALSFLQTDVFKPTRENPTWPLQGMHGLNQKLCGEKLQTGPWVCTSVIDIKPLTKQIVWSAA